MHDDEIRHISHLLDLFMEGKTTLDEEAELSTFFATHNVPDEWADYKAMMAYFDAGMPLHGDTAHTEPQEANRRWRRATIMGLRHAAWWAAAAIVVAVAVNVALHTGNDSESTTPQAVHHQIIAATHATPSAASIDEAPTTATTAHATTHRTTPKKALKATAHAIKAYHDSIATAKIDGELELCHMMAQADYDDWLNQMRQIQDATRATMLIEQGAALAMQNDNDDPGELY